jgi:hypothetical protein
MRATQIGVKSRANGGLQDPCEAPSAIVRKEINGGRRSDLRRDRKSGSGILAANRAIRCWQSVTEAV